MTPVHPCGDTPMTVKSRGMIKMMRDWLIPMSHKIKLISVLPLSYDTTLSEPHDNKIQNVYTIKPIESLRQVDANITLLAALLGKKNDVEFNLKVLRIAQRHSLVHLIANAIFAILIMPSFVLLDNPMCWLIGCLFSVLVLLPYNLAFVGTISYDVFCLIIKTFEFRYLTIINCSNQIIWLVLFRDPARFLGFVVGTVACEISLLTDAIFHLRRHAARCLAIASALAPWMVILIRIGIAPRQRDINFTIWDRRVDLIDGFVYNLFVTVWLLTGKTLPLMRLLLPNSNVTLVQCEMYYPVSHLVLVETKSGPPVISRSTHSLRKTSSKRASISKIAKRGLELNPKDVHQQIDESIQIAPPMLLKMLNRCWYMKLHPAIGWIGLVAWAISLIWHLVCINKLSTVVFLQLLVVGFSFSLIYCVLSAAHCQSTLVTRLTQQADAWFVSMQFTIFTLIACDVLYWDSRCLLVWTPWLWCHWILFLDALTPYSRRHLRYQRWMVITVEILLFLYPLGISYWFYFSRDHRLYNREYSLKLYHGLKVRVSMGSILASQVIDMLIWMGRFLWHEFYRPRHALKLIKQQVQYRGGTT